MENGKCPDLANILPLALLRIEIIKEWINPGRIKNVNNKYKIISKIIKIYTGIKGVHTIKLFNKYIKDEDNSILEVYCDNLKRDEIKELLALLEGIGFKYISVDTKSIKAVKEGDYHKIYQARKKLEKEGFT